MTGIRATVATIIALIVLALAAGSVLAGTEKVGICHATGSESNPYVFIEVANEAALNAHIDRDTGNLHGDRLGNMDFYADAEAECGGIAEPTPTETPICIEDGGDQACGPLVPCEFYGTVWTKIDGVPTEVTLDSIYVPEGFSCETTSEAPTPTPTASDVPVEATPTVTEVPNTALAVEGTTDLLVILGSLLLAASLGAMAYRALLLYRLR